MNVSHREKETLYMFRIIKIYEQLTLFCDTRSCYRGERKKKQSKYFLMAKKITFSRIEKINQRMVKFIRARLVRTLFHSSLTYVSHLYSYIFLNSFLVQIIFSMRFLS